MSQEAATNRPLSSDEWKQRDALSVEEAGKILGLGRGSSYAAARTGEIPTIRIGKRLIVPRAALERLLG
jgi:excisionase family DNA binding protein